MPKDLTLRDTIAVAVRGLTGATAASRWVGGTVTGAPATGTFQVGDFVIAQNGTIWICTAGGTPGTWAQVSGAGGGGGGGETDPLVWMGGY